MGRTEIELTAGQTRTDVGSLCRWKCGPGLEEEPGQDTNVKGCPMEVTVETGETKERKLFT